MRRILTVLPALLLSGCGLLYAEIEIPRVELTLQQEPFPGNVGGTLSKDFAYDLGSDLSVIKENDVTVVLRLQTMAIAAAATDLYPILTLSVVVVPPPGSALPEVAVLSYQRPAGATSPTHSIEAAASGDADLGPYLTEGNLTLRATATGALPPADWTGDVTAAFSLKVRYPYGKQIKL